MKRNMLIFVILLLMFFMAAVAYVRRLPAQSAAASLQQKWSFSAPEPGQISAPLAIAEDGTLYAAGENGKLYAITPAGQLQWEAEIGRTNMAPVIGAGGTIYVGNEDYLISAVNPDGSIRWHAGGSMEESAMHGLIPPTRHWPSAAIDDIYFYAPWQNVTRGVSLTSGGIEWSAEDKIQTFGSIVVLPDGRVVYPGAGWVRAVDKLGRLSWQYPAVADGLPDVYGQRTGTFMIESPLAVGSDGTLYLVAQFGRLIALSPDGTMKWEFRTKNQGGDPASPLVASDGAIYFAAGNGTLYALNPDGSQKWQLATGSAITVTPVLAQDGTIFLVNQSDLHAISPVGKVLTKMSLNFASVSSLTLGDDGTLYLAFTAGIIKAYAAGHGGLMQGPWPKFQHDQANSGRAKT